MSVSFNTKRPSQVLGEQGEDAVVAYLQERGFTILETNYRVAGGEIDVIAQQAELGVFVEVKTRTSHHFNLSQVITPTKIKRISNAAKHYIAYVSTQECAWRFDVALVEQSNGTLEINYIENAAYLT